MVLKQYQAEIILVCSILIIGLYLTNFIIMISGMRQVDGEALSYELSSFAMQLPFLLPAVLGLWKRNLLIEKELIAIGFLFYLFFAIYVYTAIAWATDPLQPGLIFVLLGLPFALGLSVFLFFQIRK